MDNPKAIMGAAGGAAIGAVSWALVSLATGMELAIFALIVGLATGGGMRLMSITKKSVEIGVIAALIAFVAVFVGKWASTFFVTQRQLMAVKEVTFSDDQMMVKEAKPLLSALVRKGVKLTWRNGKNAVTAESINDYPVQIADQAKAEWDKRGDKEARKVEAGKEEHRVQFGSVRAQRAGAFGKSFGLLDVLWIGGALAGAFFLGGASLKSEKDEDEEGGFVDDGEVIRAADADD